VNAIWSVINFEEAERRYVDAIQGGVDAASKL
jgi:hypothetical protein